MKTAIAFVLGGILFIALISFNQNIRYYKTDLSIHVHDTYFMVSYFQAGYASLVFLTILYFIGMAIGSRFEKKVN